jgi:glycosyl transferase, family 25
METGILVFVINLPERSDRRAAMARQLRKVGWTAEFIPAIRPTESAGFPSIGSRGCFLSHLKLLKLAHHQRLPEFVALEDDVNFAGDFMERWQRATAVRKNYAHWSIFYAGHSLEGLQGEMPMLDPATGVLRAHFIVFNGSALPILIEGLETMLKRPPGHPMGGPMHVDGAYSTLRVQNPSLITFASNPSLGYQRPSRSDIQELHWFDQNPLSKPLVAIGRQLRSIRRD